MLYDIHHGRLREIAIRKRGERKPYNPKMRLLKSLFEIDFWSILKKL